MTIRLKQGYRIRIHDTIYDVTPAYLDGVDAARRDEGPHSNPHRAGSQAYEDWKAGNENEGEGDHAIARII